MWRHAPSRRLSNFWDEGAPATRARIYRGWGTQLASLDHAVRADLGFQWKHILTGGRGGRYFIFWVPTSIGISRCCNLLFMYHG